MEEQNNMIEVSIVMPCLNEAETLETCIKKVQQATKKNNLNAEIIVADNGSTDGSQQIAERNNAIVVHVDTEGYGAALSGGIAAAKGKYIIMGDADDSYDFSGIFPFIKKLREGYDLVMGCRLPSGGGDIMPGAMPLKHRYLGNPLLSFVGRFLFNASVTDFHCGLRGFTKEAFNIMALRTTGMEFASEMVVKATLLKMRIAEVPITLYKDGRSRPPHLRSWRDGWRHLRFMFMYAHDWLFLLPGTVLLLFGLVVFLALVKGPLTVGNVTFDTNSLLFSAMSLLLGFQLINYYFFIKTFSLGEGLIPDAPLLMRLFSVFNLEIGIITGFFILIGGFGFLLASVVNWGFEGFGDLSYPDSLRMVILSITMIILGLQIIFSSFFMSILGLRRK